MYVHKAISLHTHTFSFGEESERFLNASIGCDMACLHARCMHDETCYTCEGGIQINPHSTRHTESDVRSI